MFQLIYEVGYRQYGGLNMRLNRWNFSPAPTEDGFYYFKICFQFDMETVLKIEPLTEAFQNTSKVYMDSVKANCLGITNSLDKVFDHLATNDFYGHTLACEGDSVEAIIPSDLDTFEMLKTLKGA